MKKRLVVANWKTYLSSVPQTKKFITALKQRARSFAGVEAWIAPSFVLLPSLAEALKGSSIKAGAQTLSPYIEGAHTGEVTGSMLKGIGAKFVIVGHSERRAHGESTEDIRAQLVRAAESGLSMVLCVGESVRDDQGSHFEVIQSQLSSALSGFPRANADKLIVAYEPVWAIGKTAAEAMKPTELQETQIYIRKILADLLGRERALAVPILYGGSVEPANAKMLIDEGGVSGFLVGHASADPKSFAAILSACRK